MWVWIVVIGSLAVVAFVVRMVVIEYLEHLGDEED